MISEESFRIGIRAKERLADVRLGGHDLIRELLVVGQPLDEPQDQSDVTRLGCLDADPILGTHFYLPYPVSVEQVHI